MKKFARLLTVVLLNVLVAAACAPATSQAGGTDTAPTTLTPAADSSEVGTIVAQTFAAMTAQAGSQPATETSTPPVTVTQNASGSISGTLSYPSSFIPPLRVVAFNIDDQSYRFVDTQPNQSTYQISGLTPGTYHVVAYTVGGDGVTSGLAGGYTQMVPCGLMITCTDNTLIDVDVAGGADTPNINPGDWYGEAGSFPPMPTQGLATEPASTPGASDAIPNPGTISGDLSYPADRIPALRIAAFAVGDMSFVAYVDTKVAEESYQLHVPEGSYFIVAYVLPGNGFPDNFVGGYTNAVACGLSASCTDHALAPVTVKAGETLTNINPVDWSSNPRIYPTMPK